jgi:MFS family permease
MRLTARAECGLPTWAMSGSSAAAERLDENALDYPGWRVTFASAVGVFVSFASLLIYTFGIFLKPLSAEFGWSREAVSLAFGIAAITVAACSPPLGLLLDRFGPRRIILPCLIVFGCGFASLALLTSHLGHLYAMFLVLGIVGNGTAQLAYSRAVATWFERRRGMAFGLLLAGGAIGAIILPPTAQALIQWLGWRGAFAVLGGMVLAVGLPVVACMVRERPGLDPHSRVAAKGASVVQGIQAPAFWILVAVLFLASLGQNGAIAHLAALLTDRHVPAQQAAIAVSALGAAGLAGRLITGWLLDRFFAPRVAFCLLAMAALGVFLLSAAHSLATGLVAAILIGAGMGGQSNVTPYLLAKYFGLRSFSTLYGFTWTAYAIAGAIGPVLMGRAFDSTASYQSLIVKLSVLTLCAAGLMLLMPKYSAAATVPVIDSDIGKKHAVHSTT